MTLIVAARDSNSAIVFSDILITAPKSERLPAITSHLRPVHLLEARQISSLVSKTCILRSNVAVAWTGTLVICRGHLRHLHTCLPQLPDFSVLIETLKSFEIIHDGAIIGAVIDGSGIHTFEYDDQSKQAKRRKLLVQGTGVTTFRDVYSTDPYKFDRRLRREKSNKMFAGRLGLWGIHKIAELSKLELLGDPTLENYFDCGYDLALSRGNKFCRIGSLYQLIYKVMVFRDTSNYILRPMDVLVTQTYRRDGSILLKRMNVEFVLSKSCQSRHFILVRSTDSRSVEPTLPDIAPASLGAQGNYTQVTLFFEVDDNIFWQQHVLTLILARNSQCSRSRIRAVGWRITFIYILNSFQP